MRSNKINNVDLFTSSANDKFSKHIKTQSKQALEIINNKINWTKLLRPIEETIINFEPRVQVSKVTASAAPDENRYNVELEFFVINSPNPITINFFLERIR